MKQTKRTFWRCLGLALAGVCVFAMPTRAQQADKKPAESPSLLEKRVTISVDSARLNRALKMVMTAADADYTIDERLREGVVTAHLKNVTLQTALETILKAASVPATYRFEDNIFGFVLREDVRDWVPDDGIASTKAEDAKPRLAAIPLNHNAAADMIAFFGGALIGMGGQNNRPGNGAQPNGRPSGGQNPGSMNNGALSFWPGLSGLSLNSGMNNGSGTTGSQGSTLGNLKP